MATQLVVPEPQWTRTGTAPPPRKCSGLSAGRRCTAPARKALGQGACRRVGELSEAERQRRLVVLLPLVKRMACQMREHLPAHIEADELVGAGMLGLVDVVGKFDVSKRVKLESYARYRIRGAILDGLRSLDLASRDMRKKSKKVERAYRELEAKLGRPVSDEEMSQALGLSLDRWYRTVQELQGLGVDWWRPLGSVGSSRPRSVDAETLVASSPLDPFAMCYRREQRDLLNRALVCLPERERLILSLYYQQELSMKQIAARLSVDESRISQLHTAALLRLKTRVQALLRPLRPALPSGLRVPAAATV
jgi:RNA polymerase sigma factor for flagellar operon FliA